MAADRAPRRGHALPRARAAPRLLVIRTTSPISIKVDRCRAVRPPRGRRDRLRATTRASGEPGSVLFVVRREALPLEQLERRASVKTRSRGLEARGKEAAHVAAAADRLRREVCGDEGHLRRPRNIQYTNVCYSLRLLRVLQGLAANPRGLRTSSRSTIVRRSEEA